MAYTAAISEFFGKRLKIAKTNKPFFDFPVGKQDTRPHSPPCFDAGHPKAGPDSRYLRLSRKESGEIKKYSPTPVVICLYPCSSSLSLRSLRRKRARNRRIWPEKTNKMPEITANKVASTWKSIPPVLGSIYIFTSLIKLTSARK